MEKKFILIATLMLAFMLASVQAVQAAECARSGTTMLITYSPNDLNVGEEFNLTFIDLFKGVGEQATLNYPSSLSIISGTESVTLLDYGTGEGYFTWRMNSTAPGNHTVYVNVSYEGPCNVTRVIEIQPSVNAPNIVLNYIGTQGNIIANQDKTWILMLKNIGTGTAYNVGGWTDLGKVIDTFSYGTIEAGNITTKEFNINTDNCGMLTLKSTANYEDEFGYNYLPSHINRSINVVGSDLEITDFDVSDTSIRKGKTLKFYVTVENKDRSTAINATDAIVKIYKDDDLIETIDLGDIDKGETASGEASWKVKGKTGKATIKAVVDSDNECGNWDNDETVKVKILKEKEEEEQIWPEPEEEEEKKEEKEEPTIPAVPEEAEEDLVAIATIAIALEIIALALVIIYLAKRKKRYRKIKELKFK